MFFSLRKEKNEKKPRTFRSIICAAGCGSMAAIKDGVHARGARVIRHSPPLSQASHRMARSFQLHRVSARRMLACRAKREQTTVGSRGYALSSRKLRVRDGSLGDSFRRFLVGEKSTYLSPLERRERMLFFTERKASKELQAYRLTVCAAGDGSVAAMKDGVHAHFVRVIRGSPPLLQASCRRALTRRAPCACGRGLPSGNHFPHGE